MEQHQQHHSTDSPATSSATRSGFFVYPKTDIHEAINACKRSLLDKLTPKQRISLLPYVDSTLGATPTLQNQENGRKHWEFDWDDTTWVDFRYEKLPQVCFKCGILGHNDKLCQNEAMHMEEPAPI
ncbi:hypothetical protein L195_g014915 [Trifolium pratense]|uniref:Zinc knuckle CX2CX4HX4C domain-containing protein n=1 Tax=Trifolium pratense TaxID=57577 RepID=A0A2K3MLU4_TRIPR|nr:hypothetical protein L195_g014915 [Trifolium pratense]